MARISLLFSLALALVLGSSFLSVYGHAPTLPPFKLLSQPKTVSELQTLPFKDIIHMLNRKEYFGPKTAEFKAMFTICKGYVEYLESLYKFENPIVDVLGIAKAKYALVTKAILAARNSVIGQVDKKTARKLRRSCIDLTKGFLQIQETIVSISATHDFKADAKISFDESKKLLDALFFFKHSINGFMDVVYDVMEKKIKKVAHKGRALEQSEDRGDKLRRFFKTFSDRFGGAKTHGRELAEAEPKFNPNSQVAKTQGFKEIIENIDHFFGGFVGGENPHGRQLYMTRNPGSEDTFEKIFGDIGKAAEGKIPHGRQLYMTRNPGSSSKDTFEKIFGDIGKVAEGKIPHGRELYVANAGIKAGAQAGVEVNESLLSKFEKLYGYKNGVNAGAQLDAAGKMKFAGGDGFRSLNREHFKHFASTEA